MEDRRRLPDILYIVVLVGISVGMLLTAPTDGSFWWSEAPRNALNGAFIFDLVRALPLDDPVGWAESYYYQYPALTVLFYPPLFHVILAMAYAVFGVSHFSAMLTIAALYLAMLVGVFRIGKRLTNVHGGLALAILFAGAPEVAIWGRQVMLEIPMMAFAVWSAWFVLRYLESNRNGDLFGAVFFALCAVYTKQTIIFLFPAFAIVILWFRWRDLLSDKRKWAIIGFAMLGLLPLIVMQLKFAAFNLTSVAHRDDVEVGKWTWEGWTWYLVRLPETIGWPATVACVLAPLGPFILPAERRARHAAVLVLSWALIAFVFFNVISLKETRHGIPLYFGLIAAGVFTGYRLIGTRLAFPLTLAAGAATLGHTWWAVPTPALPGYREAADAVVELARPNARVMFAGNRDGHFIFNVRANPDRDGLAIVRADKLLLNIRIMPSLGYGAKNFDQAKIGEMLNRYGIEWVVTVDDFWTDIPVMKELDSLLHGSQFEEVRRIAVTGNIPHKDKILVIYRNLGELRSPPEDYAIQLGAIERSVNKPD